MPAANLTFGIEIETHMPAGSVVVGTHGFGIQVPWLPTGWKADNDPSIRPPMGRIRCEFVSPILRGAAGITELIEAVKTIKAYGGKVNASCGIHVHVGFDRSNIKARERLVTLVANFEKAIFASTGTHDRENGNNPQGRIWCNSIQRHGNTAAAMARAGDQRYHILNLTNLNGGRKPTVEFRPFGSSLNVVKICGYVMMCLGLVERAVVAKRVTNFTAKAPVKGSTVYRAGGIGQTDLTRLFYQLGWCKGRTNYFYGNVTGDEIVSTLPSIEKIKKELRRLAKQYDAQTLPAITSPSEAAF